MSSGVLRSAQAGAILTALGLGVGLVTGVAQAEPAPVATQACPSPFFGDSLNQRYGVKERIIGPPDCRTAYVGERWVRAVPPWVTASTKEQADFYTNFEYARYVIDGVERIKVRKEVLQQGNVNALSLPYIVPVSPVFDKLPVCADGSKCHTSTVYVYMTNQVCTGRGNPPGLNTNCLPGGQETEWPIIDNGPFTVVLPTP